jgi:hypothetical protein
VAHGVDDDQAEHGDQDHHDDQRAEHRRVTADRAELIARHLSEAATIATGRHEQHHHVLHAAAEHGADQNPKCARQVAELRRERWTDQRTGAGDGGEVMTEHHPFIGRYEIAAVAEAHRRCGARRIQHQHACRDPGAVEPIADGIHTCGRDDHPHRVDGFATMHGEAADGERTHDGDQQPNQFIHSTPAFEKRALARARSELSFRWMRARGSTP